MESIKTDVLNAYGLQGAVCVPVLMGNLNKTWRVHHGSRMVVVQRLNPLFSPLIHHDIDVITGHLEAHGVCTPRVLRTLDGNLWYTDAEGCVWRVLSYIEGRVFQYAIQPSLCMSAACFVGKFHGVLSTLQHVFAAKRVGVHDVEKHLKNMREAMRVHVNHVAFKEASVLAEALQKRIQQLRVLPVLPVRISHGDLKFNNIVFHPSSDEVRALIDLDTLAHMPWPLEMGDALRSWCNPAGENSTETYFDAERFEAALAGYGVWHLWTQEEKHVLVDAVEMIALTLAVRFTADVLQESYFGYDSSRFDFPWMHHLERARGQWGVAKSIMEQKEVLLKRVAQYVV
jgi:Ser/Thr protein kinase RdoA (MazF antagonist)